MESVAQEAPGVVRRSWRAANEQARTIGGNLTISLDESGPVVFAFANGVTIHAAPSAERIDGLGTILGAPADVAPRVYRVSRERVSPSAEFGGLCGGLRTSYLALAEYVDERGEWTLRIASLHQPAGERRDEAGAPNLCFALDYALAAPSG